MAELGRCRALPYRALAALAAVIGVAVRRVGIFVSETWVLVHPYELCSFVLGSLM